MLAAGLLHLGQVVVSSFDPATGRRVRQLDDVLYFHHMRFKRTGYLSAARARP
ncbi:hypothetical protein SMC26_22835 [Actinomadura fulvescens]|uniref:Uncharacterized protein n=1 Tax=Actinomadura fulvescens TaxID=46160 RepID=A0ABP6CYC8_9ACTN